MVKDCAREHNVYLASRRTTEEDGVLPAVAWHGQRKVPDLVFIRLREQCNARCQMCSFWQTPDGPGLSSEQVFTLIRELVEFGVGEIVFTGGEPFYYPRLDELLERIAELAGPPAVAVITNGSRRDAIAQRVLAYPRLVRVHVSLDGLTDIDMEAIRGHVGWYRGILDFVRLVREIAPRAKVVANAIVNRHNWGCLEGYFDHDFDQVNFLLLKSGIPLEMSLPRSQAADTASRLSKLYSSPRNRLERCHVPLEPAIDLDITAFADFVWGSRDDKVPCTLTQRMAYIDHRGEVYPCNCLAHDGRLHSLGNVFHDSFPRIWEGTGRVFRDYCSGSEEWRTCVSCDPANRIYNISQSSVFKNGAIGSIRLPQPLAHEGPFTSSTSPQEESP